MLTRLELSLSWYCHVMLSFPYCFLFPILLCAASPETDLLLNVGRQYADLEVLGNHFCTESCRSVWIWRCWEVTFGRNSAAVCGSGGVVQ